MVMLSILDTNFRKAVYSEVSKPFIILEGKNIFFSLFLFFKLACDKCL